MSRLPSGRAQDPLTFLQRQIAKSARFDKATKRHVLLRIRRSKQDTLDYEQAVSESCRLWSFSQMLRLRALLDTLKETHKDYKATLWAYCKVSEDYRRYLGPRKVKGNGSGRQGGGRSSALWEGPKAAPVPPEPDGRTA